MEKRNKYIGLIALITILSTLLILSNLPLNKEIIPTKFTAAKNSGFDLTLERLNFGKITPGSSSIRQIQIQNNYEHPTITKVEVSGIISPYLTVSENNFILEPSQAKNVTFRCAPNQNTELKEYSGKIIITTKKA